MNFEIRRLTEDEFLLWDDFVDRSPQGGIYSKSFWLKHVSELNGMQFQILAAFKGKNIFGGIGLYISKGMFGNVINCPILTPYNSIILRRPYTKYPSKVAWEDLQLIKELITKLETREYASVEIRNGPDLKDIRALSWNHWDIRVRYTYKIPLFDLDNLTTTVAHNIRKQIRKCKEAGINIGTEDDVNKFYSLLRLTFKRQNKPVPIEKDKLTQFYENLRQHNCCKIYFAHLQDGKAISARITLFTKNEVAHDWLAGADREYFQVGATSFLLWRIIGDLSQQGYRYLDLNGANIESIAKFKSEFGGRLVPYYVASRYNSQILKLASTLKELGLSFAKRAVSSNLGRPELH